jgi:hypothetical protein
VDFNNFAESGSDAADAERVSNTEAIMATMSIPMRITVSLGKEVVLKADVAASQNSQGNVRRNGIMVC